MFKKLCMPIGTLARQDKTMACGMTRWHIKMRSWYAFGTLACKPCWHASTLAGRPHCQGRPDWYVDQVGMQAGMACDLASSSCWNFIDVYLLLELFFVQLYKQMVLLRQSPGGVLESLDNDIAGGHLFLA